MELSVIDRIIPRFVFVLLLLGAPLAHAAILNFDDLQFEGTQSASLPNQLSYGGFDWDAKWTAGTTDRAGFTNRAQSGTQFLFNEGATRNLTVSRDTPFDFLGAWFASPAQLSATFVRITAYGADNTLLGTTGYTNFGISPTWIGASFTGVLRLVIDPFGGTFAMDDFTYLNPVSLTEAGSLVLLMIGIFGLWAARRRGQVGG